MCIARRRGGESWQLDEERGFAVDDKAAREHWTRKVHSLQWFGKLFLERRTHRTLLISPWL